MAWAQPLFSKNKVNWAGRTLVSSKSLDWKSVEEAEFDITSSEWIEASKILSNWRASHAFPLNTFQNGLRKRGRLIDAQCLVAQRIKRLSSIEAKLIRFKTMTLSQMQDIGGCRAILSSVSNVNKLCSAYQNSQIKHKLHHEDNYITNPKSSGYRGVHLIPAAISVDFRPVALGY